MSIKIFRQQVSEIASLQAQLWAETNRREELEKVLLDALEAITSTAMEVKRENTREFMEHLELRIGEAEKIWQEFKCKSD